MKNKSKLTLKKVLIVLILINIILIIILLTNNEEKESKKNKDGEVAVLNYHFFYDEENGEKCKETICLEKKMFEKQLKYLKDNNYKTLTIHEFSDWKYKKIELTEKSVLITIDDGSMGTGTNDGNILIPLLEKYNINATIFLMTNVRDKKNFISNNLDIQSHGNNIHESGTCNKAKILCYTEEEIYNDLKTSIQRVDDNTSFAFPFYAANTIADRALAKLEVKVAFIGGNRKARISDDKYRIPRYKIYNTTTFEEFQKMIK